MSGAIFLILAILAASNATVLALLALWHRRHYEAVTLAVVDEGGGPLYRVETGPHAGATWPVGSGPGSVGETVEGHFHAPSGAVVTHVPLIDRWIMATGFAVLAVGFGWLASAF